MNKLIIVALVAICLSACVNTSRNFKPAGFESVTEVYPYLTNYLYYANKLTSEEWKTFYNRFPEYWNDIQQAKSFGGTHDYHPWYSAYAFRWTTLKNKDMWADDIIQRLSRHEIIEGDDIFKIVFAFGPPDSIIWDNDFEVLFYKSNKALIMNNGQLSKIKDCKGCAPIIDSHLDKSNNYIDGYTIIEALQKLNLERPQY